MRRLAVGIGVLVGLVSRPALAADLPLKAPPPIVLDSWAGPYIGAYFAAGGGRAKEATDGSSSEATSALQSITQNQASYAGNVTGSMVDLFAGRNWRFGNFVVGGQVEASVASDIDLNEKGLVSSNRTIVGTFPEMDLATRTSGNDPELQFRAGLVGRGGFLARPNLLLYGLAGLEFGHFFFPDQDDVGSTSDRKWAVGYTAGVGAEAALDDRWSVRAEYRYLHFGVGRTDSNGQTFGSSFGSTTDSTAVSRTDSADIQLGKIGLVYRLDQAGPMAPMATMRHASPTVWADSWAGPYVGLAFGAGSGHAAQAETLSLSENQTVANLNFTLNQTNSAVAGGGMAGTMNDVFAGYNWRTGRFVGGAQVEGTLFSDVAWQTSGPAAVIINQANNGIQQPSTSVVELATFVQQLRSTAGVVGRAGFLASPNLFLYGLGGVEFGNFVLPDGDAGGATNSKWSVGYTAGAGGEWRVDDHWSVRAEYRYLHFDVNRNDPFAESVTSTATGVGTETANTASRSAVDFHLGQVGLAYKFGGAGPASTTAVAPAPIVSSWNDGWAGPYFGGYFGAGAGHSRGVLSEQLVQTETAGMGGPSFSSQSLNNAALKGNLTGSESDLFAGYNVRNDRLIWGGQVEVSQFSDIGGKIVGVENQLTTSGAAQFGLMQTTENRQQLRSMVGLIGRAGFLVRHDLLLYGLGGLELGHFTYPDSDEQLPVQNGKWAVGYTIGAGGEWKLDDHWSMRAEYRYLHFNVGHDLNSTGVDTEGDNTFLTTTTSSLPTTSDFHLGKIGLAYRFGGDDTSSGRAAMPVKAAAGCCDRWAGFSAGAYASGGAGHVRDAVASTFGSTSTDLTQTPPATTQTFESASNILSGNMSGGTVDLFAGYNRHLGNWVVGGQVEGTIYSNIALKSNTNSAVFTSAALEEVVERQQLPRSQVGLIGRAGFLASPNLLLYGLGGLALGHFNYPDEIFQLVGGENGTWAAGYTVGAGAELKLTDRWSLRGEYRYARYGFSRSDSQLFSQTDFTSFAGSDSFANTYHTSASFNVGKVGIAYGFPVLGQ